MGVYIKGMEMPTNCDDCLLGCDCPHDQSIDGYKMQGGRPRTCPIIPVPAHGRLIDADDAVGHLFNGEQCLYSWDEIEEAIDATETVIPAEEGE